MIYLNPTTTQVRSPWTRQLFRKENYVLELQVISLVDRRSDEMGFRMMKYGEKRVLTRRSRDKMYNNKKEWLSRLRRRIKIETGTIHVLSVNVGWKNNSVWGYNVHKWEPLRRPRRLSLRRDQLIFLVSGSNCYCFHSYFLFLLLMMLLVL